MVWLKKYQHVDLLSQEAAEEIHDLVSHVIKKFLPAIMKDPDACQEKNLEPWIFGGLVN